jgi:hypothetical protein
MSLYLGDVESFLTEILGPKKAALLTVGTTAGEVSCFLSPQAIDDFAQKLSIVKRRPKPAKKVKR